jgi:hypothetical protein
MIADNFQLFITVDKNLPYQQNLDRLPLTIFVLNAKDNRRSSLQKLIPHVFERINMGNLQNVIEISNI